MTTRAIMDPLGYSSREQEVEDRNNNNNAGSVMQGVASYTSRTDAIQEVESPSSTDIERGGGNTTSAPHSHDNPLDELGLSPLSPFRSRPLLVSSTNGDWMAPAQNVERVVVRVDELARNVERTYACGWSQRGARTL